LRFIAPAAYRALGSILFAKVDGAIPHQPVEQHRKKSTQEVHRTILSAGYRPYGRPHDETKSNALRINVTGEFSRGCRGWRGGFAARWPTTPSWAPSPVTTYMPQIPHYSTLSIATKTYTLLVYLDAARLPAAVNFSYLLSHHPGARVDHRARPPHRYKRRLA